MRKSGVYSFPEMDRVIYGTPTRVAVRKEAERLNAKRVFLIVSNTLNTTTDEIEKIRTELGPLHASTYDAVPQHTSRTSAIAVTKAALEADADLIVAVGGGSVIDVAKIATMCMEHGIVEEDGLDGYERKGKPGGAESDKTFRTPRVRNIAVPTTLSGGEYNAGALVTDTRRKWKQIFYHREMMPLSIILDPEITVHTPATLWLGSGTRAMDHGIEALCSARGTPLVDAAVLRGIALLAEGMPLSKADPTDIEARRLCQFGSWLSAFGLQARVPMGASHAIGHVLGGTYDVPHYLITPVLMPSVLRYNKPATGEAQALIAEALGHPGKDAAEALEIFLKSLGLPRRLDEVGVTKGDYEKIGEIAVKSIFSKTNPRTLSTPADVVELLSMQS